MAEKELSWDCLPDDVLKALDCAPYEPWTPLQRQAHEAALANGWQARSVGPCEVVYQRGSDYLSLSLAGGTRDLATGRLSGNGRITYGAAPRHYITTWAKALAYLDRPKGRPYRGAK